MKHRGQDSGERANDQSGRSGQKTTFPKRAQRERQASDQRQNEFAGLKRNRARDQDAGNERQQRGNERILH